MKIPRVKDVKKFLDIYSPDELYSSSMELLAVQDVSLALKYLVMYMSKTGLDLSKEVIELANHPDSLTVSTHCARYLMKLNNKRVAKRISKKLTSRTASGSQPTRLDSVLSDFSKEVSNQIDSIHLVGMDVVLIGRDGSIYQAGVNARGYLQEANMGLDCLKRQVIDNVMKSQGNEFFDSGSSHKRPDNPLDRLLT